MSVKKILDNQHKKLVPKAGNDRKPKFKQSYYLDFLGFTGRMYVDYLHWGFEIDNGTGARLSMPSPLTVRADPNWVLEPFYHRFRVFAQETTNYFNNNQTIPDSLKYKICHLGIETHQEGRVFLDVIYKLFQVSVIREPVKNGFPFYVFNFHHTEKVW